MDDASGRIERGFAIGGPSATQCDPPSCLPPSTSPLTARKRHLRSLDRHLPWSQHGQSTGGRLGGDDWHGHRHDTERREYVKTRDRAFGPVPPPWRHHRKRHPRCSGPHFSLWRAEVVSTISVHDFYVSVGAGSQTAVLVHNCPGTRDGDLPARGEPDSSSAKDYGDGNGQIRDYGPDGRAETDYDFGHDHGAGDPHAHDWDWNQTPPRGPGRPLFPGE